MTTEPVQELTPIQKLKAQLDALMTSWWELKADYDDKEYLSLPVGYLRALEVETSDDDDEPGFLVSIRRWDITGGVADDDLIFAVATRLPIVAASFLQFYVNNILTD